MESQYDRLTTNLRLIKDLITYLGNRDSDSEESLIGLDQIMDKYFNKTTAMFHGYVWSVSDSGVGQWVLSVKSRQVLKKQERSRGRRKKKKFAALPWSTL